MTESLLPFILVGFVAQIVDGALGMAYGVISSSFLLGLGVPPAAASAGVHTAEVFTTGVSGLCHWRTGNVDRRLFMRLVIPGAAGGILGAWILVSVPGERIKPFVAFYLLAMGLVVLRKAFGIFRPARGRGTPAGQEPARFTSGLGLAGGFFDAVGGGGWGPIVTSTLVARGQSPRHAVGSVNLAEFFVTVVQTAAFVALQGFSRLGTVILGLVIGGTLAAPVAALVARRLAPRTLMFTVGILITLLSFRTIYLAVF